MLRALAVALLLVALAVPATAAAKPGRGTLTHHTLAATGKHPARDYWLYVPPKLPPAGSRALVTYLHGCTQPAEEASKGTRWNELADERGFVVVYPDQRVPDGGVGDYDGSAARCWSPGQAETTERFEGEIGAVAEITRLVGREQHADPGRSYVAGISGGAMMATTMAVVYPDLYMAVGHVANCGYLCGDATGELAYRRMGEYARVVPAMVVQGSADFLINPALGETAVTQWLGVNDHADNGVADGSVPRNPTRADYTESGPVPDGSGELCADNLTHHNPCPGGVLGPYPVMRRFYEQTGGPVVVEAWTVFGLSHNYSGGDAEGSFTDPYGPNITPPLFDFFEAHAKPTAPVLGFEGESPPEPARSDDASAQAAPPAPLLARCTVRFRPLRLVRRRAARVRLLRVYAEGVRVATLRGRRALGRPVAVSITRGARVRVKVVARLRGARAVRARTSLRCG